jgi:hypothetical protein
MPRSFKPEHEYPSLDMPVRKLPTLAIIFWRQYIHDVFHQLHIIRCRGPRLSYRDDGSIRRIWRASHDDLKLQLINIAAFQPLFLEFPIDRGFRLLCGLNDDQILLPFPGRFLLEWAFQPIEWD